MRPGRMSRPVSRPASPFAALTGARWPFHCADRRGAFVRMEVVRGTGFSATWRLTMPQKRRFVARNEISLRRVLPPSRRNESKCRRRGCDPVSPIHVNPALHINQPPAVLARAEHAAFEFALLLLRQA